MKLQINKKEMSSLFNKAKWTFSLTEEEFLYLKNLLNKGLYDKNVLKILVTI